MDLEVAKGYLCELWWQQLAQREWRYLQESIMLFAVSNDDVNIN